MFLTRLLALAFAGAVALGSVAGAQSSPARLGIAAGATAPVGGYGTGRKVGYHIGLLVDIRTPSPVLGARIDGAFHELGYSGNSTKEDIWIIDANAVVKVPTGTPVVPYMIGGAGFYNSHRTLLFRTQSNTDVGLNIGGGLRFELGDATTFVEARYHVVSGDAKIRIVPITLGVLF